MPTEVSKLLLRIVVHHLRLSAAAVTCLTFMACGSETPPRAPQNLVVSVKQPRPWPTAPVAAANAAPRIVRIWLSRLEIQPGSSLDGTIVASTNVASVEVRTPAFSINSVHAAQGQFRFHTHILELPPLSRRHTYTLDFIARNTAGVQTIEQAPLRIQ